MYKEISEWNETEFDCRFPVFKKNVLVGEQILIFLNDFAAMKKLKLEPQYDLIATSMSRHFE